ncbi:hypothetical protein JXL21_01740 [Candidatus Bathyarchaeota archaeon]|nr:hypothetical protein [Candidatus Bathyarchaeota archaeon]
MIKQIEEEMRRTQINKATERHLGVLKTRLAKVKHQPRSRGEGPNLRILAAERPAGLLSSILLLLPWCR